MSILLVDADSKKGFPNLALMKYSAYYKKLGNKVDLIRGIPTTQPLYVYKLALISCIYFQNKEKVLDYAQQLSFPYQLGGSGIGHKNLLPYNVEHIMPDYGLYGTDFSMGFTSRGCIRKCKFCIVPKKEGYICDHAPISEFLHPEHKKLILLDNNFQASPKWRENLGYIIDLGLKINFNQGLDVRLMNKEFAERLAQVKYYSWNMKTRGFHMAFDSPKYEKAVRRGIKILNKAGIPSRHMMFYILCGYDTTHDEDKERVSILLELGAKPYIMPYNQSSDPWVRNYARFINRKYYEFLSMDEYNGGCLV